MATDNSYGLGDLYTPKYRLTSADRNHWMEFSYFGGALSINVGMKDNWKNYWRETIPPHTYSWILAGFKTLLAKPAGYKEVIMASKYDTQTKKSIPLYQMEFSRDEKGIAHLNLQIRTEQGGEKIDFVIRGAYGVSRGGTEIPMDEKSLMEVNTIIEFLEGTYHLARFFTNRKRENTGGNRGGGNRGGGGGSGAAPKAPPADDEEFFLE